MSFILPEIELVKIKSEKKDKFQTTFVFEPLAPGYGLTIGHALRRVLLSSLIGAAITNVKIEDASHEFSTLPGVKEDVIEIILNLKSLRLKLTGTDKVVLKLVKKGSGEVTAGDFEKNSEVEIIDPKHHIADLDKKGKLNIEATVEKGRGYISTEARTDEKNPLGTIAVDAIYTPIKKIHYEVENTRVGDRTDFDKLTLDITSDGTITPEEALKQATEIVTDYFSNIMTKYGAGDKKVPSAKKKSAPQTKTKKPTVKTKQTVKKSPKKK